MATKTTEKDFESSIEAHLVANGFIRRKPEQYDRATCLDRDQLFQFIEKTQPETWKKLKQQHGEQVKERFLSRLVKEIEARGALDVLRKGITDLGCKFDFAYFQPESTLNPDHEKLYQGNIFSVMRQVHYSTKNENSIDVMLFLNGLPIITAELKNPLRHQTVEHAIKQYKFDRDPKEPLLSFGRCLAHFAVDPEMIFMVSELKGGGTQFLPFNKGCNKGAGNPLNATGYKTAYLWEEVWQKDSLLEIIQHFLQVVDVEDDKGKPTGRKKQIFPRYHQIDAVRRLVADAKVTGDGKNYLIQHSAGSGKSNSIAWLTHRLASLHSKKDERVFDSVIVITDRRILDRQIQKTIRSFSQVIGVVTCIENQKSKELAKALEQGKDIIITTLQTFPFVAEKLTKLSGKRFAVVIDEAHSSQSGETNKALKEVLTAKTLEAAEKAEGGESSSEEDEINKAVEAAMKVRGRLKNVSFFAFTATPKAKTLELFGTPQPDGTFVPFSLYSMRQAIEENFILDVLKNYTTLKIFFALIKKVQDDPQYERNKGTFLLRSYADIHPHAIAKKVEVMVEHFHGQVRDRIGKKAKAMIVTRSRLHAVRYKQAVDKFLKDKKYPYKALVAFSGEVLDPDTGMKFTESGMNGFPESQTAETFKGKEFRFLIVAEKFQTGFDQPLLHTMYVDKVLTGLNAVQTLSRLNRICPPEKEDTFILDFTNDADDIQKAFQPYYESTTLTEKTDPNKLYDLKRMLEDYHVFNKADVDAFAKIYFSEKGKQEQLHAILNPIVDNFKAKTPDKQAAFRSHLKDFVRLYAFLAQVIRFADAELEKFYQLTRHIRLPLSSDKLPIELMQNINMDSYRIQTTSTGTIKLLAEDGELKPIGDLGTAKPKERDFAPLSELIQYINENFGTEFTTKDKVQGFADDMQRRLDKNEVLKEKLDPFVNPSVETRKLAFDSAFGETMEDMIDSNFDLYKKFKEDPNFAAMFQAYMFQKFIYTKPNG